MPNKPQATTIAKNYKILTTLNIAALLSNIILAALDIIDFIFDRPPSYTGPKLGSFLWHSSGVIGSIFLLTAFLIAVFLAATPYYPQAKHYHSLTRNSILNLIIGCFLIFFGSNVDTKMFLLYISIPLILLAAKHLSHPQIFKEASNTQSPPVTPTQSLSAQPITSSIQSSRQHPLTYFTFFIIAVELYFLLLSYTGSLTGKQLSGLGVAITTIISCFINIFLLALLTRHQNSPSPKNPSLFVAILLCLWPMVFTVMALATSLIETIF